MYISLSMDPYNYDLTISVRRRSSSSETIRALLYKFLFLSNKLNTFKHLDYRSKNLLFY